jgi:hypothetical protein
MELVAEFNVPLGWRNQYCGLYRAVTNKKKLQHYFIDNEYYFYRDTAYGYNDDGERFAYFSKAVLESLQYLNWYCSLEGMRFSSSQRECLMHFYILQNILRYTGEADQKWTDEKGKEFDAIASIYAGKGGSFGQ